MRGSMARLVPSRGRANLGCFPRLSRKRLVVGDFKDNLGDVATELRRDGLWRNLLILNRVVEQRRDDGLLISIGGGDQGRDFKEMVDIGLLVGTLSPLGRMPLGGDIGCPDDENWIDLRRNQRAPLIPERWGEPPSLRCFFLGYRSKIR
jgi:hypothetical protein